MAIKKNELVIVEWVDSVQPIPSWQRLSELHIQKPVSCFSVGWVVFSNKNIKMLAPNIGEKDSTNAQASGIITIPVCSIKRIKRLKERN